jgi:predicted GNAT family N-acyltransferase
LSQIHIIKLNFKDIDFIKIKNIRKIIFTDELCISESELFDERDEFCDHFIIFDGKNIVGAVRFVPSGNSIKLERMGILQEYRTKNYGRDCIVQLKEFYSVLGYSQIFLDSIYSVRNFYKKCGFIEKGTIFQRVGIEHIRMSLNL